MKNSGLTWKYRRQEKMLTVPEDWYPCFPNSQVECSLIMALAPKRSRQESFVRVCLWGNDDFGLEKDFKPSEFQIAKKLYNSLKDGITQKELRELGFYNA